MQNLSPRQREFILDMYNDSNRIIRATSVIVGACDYNIRTIRSLEKRGMVQINYSFDNRVNCELTKFGVEIWKELKNGKNNE